MGRVKEKERGTAQVNGRAWLAVDRKVAFPFPHPLFSPTPTSHPLPFPLPPEAIKYLPTQTAHEDHREIHRILHIGKAGKKTKGGHFKE